jgi:hypothetical protein
VFSYGELEGKQESDPVCQSYRVHVFGAHFHMIGRPPCHKKASMIEIQKINEAIEPELRKSWERTTARGPLQQARWKATVPYDRE